MGLFDFGNNRDVGEPSFANSWNGGGFASSAGPGGGSVAPPSSNFGYDTTSGSIPWQMSGTNGAVSPPAYTPPSLLQQAGGGSRVGPDGATFLQSAAGGVNADGTTFKGWGGGALSAATAVGSGYMNWKNLKAQEKAQEFAENSWLKNYAANKQAYNQNATDMNAVRASRKGGAPEVKQLA